MKTNIQTLIHCSLFSILLSSCHQLATEGGAIALNANGVELMQRQSWGEAANLFRQGLAINGVSNKTKALLYRNLGQALKATFGPDSALVYFEKAAPLLTPNSYLYFLNAADINLAQSNIDNAIANYNKAISSDPKQTEPYLICALFYLNNFDSTQAPTDAKKALEYSVKALDIVENLTTESMYARCCFANKDYITAEKYYNTLAQNHPDFLDFEFGYAKSVYMQGRKKEANEMFDALISKSSNLVYPIQEFQSSNGD